MTPAELAAIHGAAFGFPRPWSEAEFASLLADPTVVLLTGLNGFLLARCAADEAEILTLAVRPEARRQGVGRDLVRQFIAEVSARGASRAFLEVAVSNGAAIALYRQMGFVESGRRPRYFARADGTREDALLLSRAIGAGA